MELGGDRRVVSVLVTDLVGSTTIAERLGPERTKVLFDEIARVVETAVERYGGTVAQHTGDGVLAVFGAPVAHEDDAERAVRAAFASHESLAALGRELGDAYGIELVGRAAINTGPVMLPRGELAPDLLYNALGDTVNVAARLQPHALPGGVVVGALTARQVDDRFELEALGELELKGRSETVSASRVLREKADSPESLTELVGREGEVDALERVFGELVEGRGAILCVTGEPGIGKSRLAAEARRRFGGSVQFLGGHGVAYAESIPYWPVRELLRGWLDLGVADPDARVRLELRTALRRLLGAEADEAYPFLATLLGLARTEGDVDALGNLNSESARRQTHDILLELVSSLARKQPLCVVLDDLHWADDATLELVEELLAVAESDPLVLLLLYRSERDHGAWELGQRGRQRFPHLYNELELHPLDDSERRALAVEAAGAPLPDQLAGLLGERSGGNPYFLEQALRDLLERGALVLERGEYLLADDVIPTVPVVLQDALQARLDRLSADAYEVVCAAAVIGQSFATPLLERLLPEMGLRPALSELQRLDLVVEARRRPVPEYRFRHVLLREVAYGSLVDGRRRALHLAAGQGLEELNADDPAGLAGLLAHHFVEADEPEPAARYLVAAGDAARRLYANDEALVHYQRAVPFLDRIGDELLAHDVLLRVGLTLHLQADYARANEVYQEAFVRTISPRSYIVPTERIELADDPPDAFVPGHANSAIGWKIAGHLFRGLLALDRDLNVVPDVASSFEISSDGLTYQFVLQRDRVWSDGAPVTARDFVEGWRCMREQGARAAPVLGCVARAEAADEHTLRVELVSPRTYFLYLCAMPPLFPWPMHVVSRLGRDWHRASGLVGNGPYVLVSYDERGALLRARPDWRRFTGNVSEVAIHFVTSEASVAAWRDGELDIVATFDAYLDEETVDANRTRVIETDIPLTSYFAFPHWSRAVADVRVRRALALAVDRAQLFRDIRAIPAHLLAYGGVIPPSMPGHKHRIPALGRPLVGGPAGRRRLSRRPQVARAPARGRGLATGFQGQRSSSSGRSSACDVRWTTIEHRQR